MDFMSPPPMVTARGSACACAESFGSKGSATALRCSPLCFRLCLSHCCSPREKKKTVAGARPRGQLGAGVLPKHRPPRLAACPCRTLTQGSQPAPTQEEMSREGRWCSPAMLLGDIPASPQAWGLLRCVHHPVAALTVIFPREHQLLPALPLLQMRWSELRSAPPRAKHRPGGLQGHLYKV